MSGGNAQPHSMQIALEVGNICSGSNRSYIIRSRHCSVVAVERGNIPTGCSWEQHTFCLDDVPGWWPKEESAPVRCSYVYILRTLVTVTHALIVKETRHKRILDVSVCHIWPSKRQTRVAKSKITQSFLLPPTYSSLRFPFLLYLLGRLESRCLGERSLEKEHVLV